MNLSIIIVNYNSFEFVKKCIVSLDRYIENINFEVIVVDNNSSDREIEGIESLSDKVKLVSLKDNKGFGFANNIGAGSAKGKLLLFLNPDTYLFDNSIMEMISFYETGKHGIVSPFLLYEDRSLQYCHDKFHTVFFLFSEAFYFNNFFIKKAIKKDELLINERSFKIDWALGAALLIDRLLFVDIGMFDERFFMYYEDSDIAKRVLAAGYKNYCFPSCRIVHYLNAVTENKRFAKYHTHKSRLIYIVKYFNVFQVLFLRIVFIFSILLRMLINPVLKAGNRHTFEHYMKTLKLYFVPAKKILNG